MKDRTLVELLQNLCTVDDMAWGLYAFSKDILKDRVPYERKKEMITKAALCGKEWAIRMREQTKTSSPSAMAETLGLSITENGQPMTANRVLFAQFVPERSIEIMREPLDTYAALYQKEAAGENALFFPTTDEVQELLTAHEVFHYVEEANAKSIYTRTETIRLWKILMFKNDSTVRAVGEIAAMSFAKELTGIGYSPFILDFLLFVGYNKSEAETIYDKVIMFTQDIHTAYP